MKGKKVLALLGSLCLVLLLVVPFVAGCGGAVTPPPPAQTGTIILGAALSLGYPDGSCGRDNLQYAVDKINADGGFKVGNVTYTFQIYFDDTRDLEPVPVDANSLSAIQDLITNKHADFMVGGPIRSAEALNAMDWNYQYGYNKIFIFSDGFFSTLFGPKVAGNYTKYKYCFRTQGSALPLANECLAVIQAINATYGAAHGWGASPTVYMIYQNVGHAVNAYGILSTTVPAAGFTWGGASAIPTGTTDFSAPLAAADASGTRILIPWFDMPESSNLIIQWYNGQYNMIPVGFCVPGQDSRAWANFATSTSSKVAYLVDTYPQAGFTPFNSQAAAYISYYGSRKAGLLPAETWVGPTCFEAPYILKDAILRCATNYTDTAAMITALEATNLQGIYGLASFNTTTHDIIRTLDPATGAISTWYQWQGTNSTNGQRVPVYPAAVGSLSSIVLPPWMP
jgi:branched-chain amino acid transport system substrate-binding protein